MLNRLRTTRGGGRAQPGSPRWRDRGYRCIGGVLYRVSANKLSKTYGRPSGEGSSRPLLRAGQFLLVPEVLLVPIECVPSTRTASQPVLSLFRARSTAALMFS